MTDFIIIVLLCFLLVGTNLINCSKSIKVSVLFTVIISFSLIAAFRSVNVPDTAAYIKLFNSQIGVSLFAENTTGYEIGFIWLTRLCAIISKDYRVFFFIIALIIGLLGSGLTKNYDVKLLGYALFISFYGIYTSFVILRAGLAIALFAYGVMRCDKKPVKRIIFFIASMLFHISAIPLIIIYLLAYLLKKVTVNYFAALIFFGILVVLHATSVSRYFLLTIRDFIESFESTNILAVKAVSYLTRQVEDFEFGISIRYCLNLFTYLYMLYMVKLNKVELTSTQRANIVFIFIGLSIESLWGNQLTIGRITDFINVINISSMVTIFSVYKDRIISLNASNGRKRDIVKQIGECNAEILILSAGFILLNLLFIYRIMY